MEQPGQHEADGGSTPDYTPALLYNVLSHELCARAIDMAQRIGFSSSGVYSHAAGEESRPDVRRCGSAYLDANEFPEVYNYMGSVVQKMNRTLYRFQLSGLEPLQVIRYDVGGFFAEHIDISTRRTANRKLSVIVQLSDGHDYTGGDVAMYGGVNVPRTRGWGIIFPSWVPHRVEEITSGTRYALVTWAVGNFFV
jgi:PKHD-type hydroxylase